MTERWTPTKTELIEDIETTVDNLLTEHILFYMSEYREVTDYYFVADVFKHKCSALALRIANELYKADEEDEE
jgi:hypothetical protein